MLKSGMYPDSIREIKSGSHKIIIPKSKGEFVKTPDTLLMSPRSFLRIGKVIKENEEPLTVAQVKHRDRSYIISKLNQKLQQFTSGGSEKKNLNRNDYLDYMAKLTSELKPQNNVEFTRQAELDGNK